MNVSLYQAASALNATNRWQDIISQNMTAGSIPGYKKQDVSFSAVQAGLMNANAGAVGQQRFLLPKAEGVSNFQAGELKYTAGKTDVAIEGNGFFEVAGANGQLLYTRDGEFRTNTLGQLTTKNGFAVMGDSGPIQIDPRNQDAISISETGEVKQGADVKGKLRVMQFDNPQMLTVIGGGFYAANANTPAAPATTAVLRQGFIEESNAKPTEEMVNLLMAMRYYEANQKSIQTQDDRMGKAITELGTPS